MTKLVSSDRRKQIIDYYQTHNTEQTAKEFSISKETVWRYAKRYNGTETSLIDRRQIRVSRFYTRKEEELLRKSLEKYNKAGRKRNVITPTFTEIYCVNPEFKGLRTYSACRKKAARILGVCRRGRVSKKKAFQSKKYHEAKEPGTVQIDKLYVPFSCYKEIATSPEYLEKVKEQIIRDEKRICQETVTYFEKQAEQNVALKQVYQCLIMDFIKDCELNCGQIIASTAEELLDKRFYQYTGIDECTRWCFRRMFNTQDENAAMQFLTALIQRAPFPIKKVHTDNGSEFTSKYLKNHGPDYETPFELCLQAKGIKHYRIQPGKPWQNGRVESQHRLDRERFYVHLAMTSLEQANEMLERYNKESNQYVRHCLNRMSANEKLRGFQCAKE